jgi:hypothetical protein
LDLSFCGQVSEDSPFEPVVSEDAVLQSSPVFISHLGIKWPLNFPVGRAEIYLKNIDWVSMSSFFHTQHNTTRMPSI